MTTKLVAEDSPESFETAVANERRQVVLQNAPRSLVGFFLIVLYVAMVEWATRPTHRGALLIVGSLYVAVALLCLLFLRLYPQRAVSVAVVGVNAIGAAMLSYSPMVKGSGELCVLALNILLGGFAIMFPLGWHNQMLASLFAIIGYPLILQLGTTTAYPAWYSASALAAFLFVFALGARAIDRYRERILRDSMRQATLAAHNAQLMQEARAAERAKADLVVTLSHELRTPLSNIVGYGEVLLEGGYEDSLEQRHALHRILDQAGRMLDLVHAMLDVDRLGNGRLVLKIEEFDVIELMDRVRDDLPSTWRRHGVQLRWHAPLPGIVMRNDRAKLEVVLRNLIHNALKFTTVGAVSITATHLAEEDCVRFTVTDTGDGIAPEELPYVFQRFRQGGGGSPSPEGAGLGLFIVDRFTEALGGRVRIESTRGIGTQVELIIPVDRQVSPAVASTGAPKSTTV
jgi:signal transduction histidine kinase